MPDNATLILLVFIVVGATYWSTLPDTGGLSSLSPSTPGRAPAPVQQSPSVSRNFASVVAQAKAQLEADGVDLSGPCGAFQITRLSAQLIGGDCGLLAKPSGNNCDGFAVDIHLYRDGFHYDVIGDGGGANNPQYNLVGLIDDVGRWRQP